VGRRHGVWWVRGGGGRGGPGGGGEGGACPGTREGARGGVRAHVEEGQELPPAQAPGTSQVRLRGTAGEFVSRFTLGLGGDVIGTECCAAFGAFRGA
jgi:hypothetical protein